MALDAKETEIRDRLHAARDAMVTRVAEMVAIPSGHGHREGLERLQSIPFPAFERALRMKAEKLGVSL